MQKCKAVTYENHGAPDEVLHVSEIDLPVPGPGEALVRMHAAPINPVDLNVIEGKYPVRPTLPAIAGNEGVGIVDAVGANVTDLAADTPVLVPTEFGSWREAGVIAAEKLIPIPCDIPLEQAAMLKINPPTAWRMLHDFVTLQRGDWILQNAANSAVGRAVIQIAKISGWRTVNVVRRDELIDELQEEGADVVLLESDDLPAQIKDATEGAKIPLAFNAVGGESALRLANALAPGGTIVTYGAMGRQPLRIPNGLLIFKDLRWRGFWVTQWYRTASHEDIHSMFKHLCPLVARGNLHSKIEQFYAIDDALAAVKHAQQSRRTGKILLRLH